MKKGMAKESWDFVSLLYLQTALCDTGAWNELRCLKHQSVFYDAKIKEIIERLKTKGWKKEMCVFLPRVLVLQMHPE